MGSKPSDSILSASVEYNVIMRKLRDLCLPLLRNTVEHMKY